MSLADRWHPFIARGANSWDGHSKVGYLWFCLAVSDPTLVEPSALERSGAYAGGSWVDVMKSKRDQSVRLDWEHLRVVLDQITRVGRNASAWRLLYGRGDYFANGNGLVWEVQSGGHVARWGVSRL